MDSLFVDPMAHLLAGSEGRRQPMGAWILVPRTRRGDDVLVEGYRAGCRQLVQLGAGMDARAYRVFAPDSNSPPAAASADGSWRGGVKLDELAVFEVDQGTTFDVKEPLLEGAPLTVKSRHAIAADFALRGDWADALVRGGHRARPQLARGRPDHLAAARHGHEGLVLQLSAGVGDKRHHLLHLVGRPRAGRSPVGEPLFAPVFDDHFVAFGPSGHHSILAGLHFGLGWEAKSQGDRLLGDAR